MTLYSNVTVKVTKPTQKYCWNVIVFQRKKPNQAWKTKLPATTLIILVCCIAPSPCHDLCTGWLQELLQKHFAILKKWLRVFTNVLTLWRTHSTGHDIDYLLAELLWSFLDKLGKRLIKEDRRRLCSQDRNWQAHIWCLET